jgi:xanthine dehydrogenase FAD-binding subunit
VVDITRIPELHTISRNDNLVNIGAAATFNEVLSNPIIQETAPVLCLACRQVGAEQIRNMGTIGGNVANAAACADSLPALVCLDAKAVIITPTGSSDIPVSELVTGPNQTRIPPGGLLTSFHYSVPEAGSRSIFLKLGRRNAMAISRLSLAVLGRLDDQGCITEVRIVPGAATPAVQRFTNVELALLGKKPDSILIQSAARLTVDELVRMAGRRWSSEYKIPALEAMIINALTNVFSPPSSSPEDSCS